MGRSKIDPQEKKVQVPLIFKQKVVDKIGKSKIQYEAEKYINEKYAPFA